MTVLTPKGLARREKLVNAALILLTNRSPDEISLKDIAETAGIPVGSSYHFFANSQEVFTLCAKKFGEELIAAINADYSETESESWQKIYSTAVDRAISIYRRTPAYCQLILGGKTPPAVKFSDRKNDTIIGQEFITIMDRHFVVFKQPDLEEKVFYSIEIVDLFLSLSYIYSHKLETSMIEEAKAAGIAYLQRYIPMILPKK